MSSTLLKTYKELSDQKFTKEQYVRELDGAIEDLEHKIFSTRKKSKRKKLEAILAERRTDVRKTKRELDRLTALMLRAKEEETRTRSTSARVTKSATFALPPRKAPLKLQAPLPKDEQKETASGITPTFSILDMAQESDSVLKPKLSIQPPPPSTPTERDEVQAESRHILFS